MRLVISFLQRNTEPTTVESFKFNIGDQYYSVTKDYISKMSSPLKKKQQLTLGKFFVRNIPPKDSPCSACIQRWPRCYHRPRDRPTCQRANVAPVPVSDDACVRPSSARNDTTGTKNTNTESGQPTTFPGGMWKVVFSTEPLDDSTQKPFNSLRLWTLWADHASEEIEGVHADIDYAACLQRWRRDGKRKDLFSKDVEAGIPKSEIIFHKTVL